MSNSGVSLWYFNFKAFSAAWFAVMAFSSVPGLAQDNANLEDRVKELERRVSELEKAGASKVRHSKGFLRCPTDSRNANSNQRDQQTQPKPQVRLTLTPMGSPMPKRRLLAPIRTTLIRMETHCWTDGKFTESMDWIFRRWAHRRFVGTSLLRWTS